MLKDDMRISEYVAYLIISVVTALIICSVFIVIVGGNPLSAFLCMFREAFFTRYGLSEIIVRATPLTLIALGITISHKAGIMNLGGDGQLYLGAIVHNKIMQLNLLNNATPTVESNRHILIGKFYYFGMFTFC